MTIDDKAFPFSGRHLVFPVESILPVNFEFRSGTIFRKSRESSLRNVNIRKILPYICDDDSELFVDIRKFFIAHVYLSLRLG